MNRNLLRMNYIKFGILFIISGIIASAVGALFGASGKTAVGICAGVIIIVFAGTIYLTCKSKRKGQSSFAKESQNDKVGNNRKLSIALEVAAYLLIATQIIVAIGFADKTTFAIKNIKYATEVFEGKAPDISHLLMSFWGILSYTLKIHPMTLIHTVLAVFIISLAYESYIMLAKAVFKDNIVMQYGSVIAVGFINIYGFWSPKASIFTLLLGYFTFAGIAVHILLVNLSTLLIKKAEKNKKAEADKRIEAEKNLALENGENSAEHSIDYSEDDDYQEEWDMKKHKIINARNLAIGLGVLVLMLIALAYVLNNKINKLYEVTVLLQSEMDSECKMYEFAPNGVNEGYVVKNSDGSITVIGGGSAENAQSLSEIIKKYGDVVDTWYVYGSDDKNIGAYRKCKDEKGITVNNVYELTRTDVE